MQSRASPFRAPPGQCAELCLPEGPQVRSACLPRRPPRREPKTLLVKKQTKFLSVSTENALVLIDLLTEKIGLWLSSKVLIDEIEEAPPRRLQQDARRRQDAGCFPVRQEPGRSGRRHSVDRIQPLLRQDAVLAKELMLFMHGDENALVQIDMSEYMEKHNVNMHTSTPPGCVGHEQSGHLTGKIRRPSGKVLLDEIEKGSPRAGVEHSADGRGRSLLDRPWPPGKTLDIKTLAGRIHSCSPSRAARGRRDAVSDQPHGILLMMKRASETRRLGSWPYRCLVVWPTPSHRRVHDVDITGIPV